jgi:hypothetical protein
VEREKEAQTSEGLRGHKVLRPMRFLYAQIENQKKVVFSGFTICKETYFAPEGATLQETLLALSSHI